MKGKSGYYEKSKGGKNINFGVYAVAATSYTFDYEIINSTSMRINWGDGNTDTLTGTATATHTYSTTGSYRVSIVPLDGDITDFVKYYALGTLNFTGSVDFSKASNLYYFFHNQGIYSAGGVSISSVKITSNVAMQRLAWFTETSNSNRTGTAAFNILEISDNNNVELYGILDLQLKEDVFLNMPSKYVSFRSTSSSMTGLTNPLNDFNFLTFGIGTVFENFETLNFTDITTALYVQDTCTTTTQSDNLMISIQESATLNNVQNKTLDFTNNSALSATGLAAKTTLEGLNWTVTT